MDINSITSAVKDATDFDARKKGWNDWMQKPENRAFLLQTGISLLQGPVRGQTTLGAIGTSIGQGAAARDRYIQGQNEQQQTEFKNKQAAQATSIDQQRATLDQQRFKEAQDLNNSTKEYRKQMGLAAVLNAQKARTGRVPQTADEGWQKTLGTLISLSTPPDQIEQQRQTYYKSLGMVPPPVGGDTGAGAVDWTIDENGNPVYTGAQ